MKSVSRPSKRKPNKFAPVPGEPGSKGRKPTQKPAAKVKGIPFLAKAEGCTPNGCTADCAEKSEGRTSQLFGPKPEDVRAFLAIAIGQPLSISELFGPTGIGEGYAEYIKASYGRDEWQLIATLSVKSSPFFEQAYKPEISEHLFRAVMELDSDELRKWADCLDAVKKPVKNRSNSVAMRYVINRARAGELPTKAEVKKHLKDQGVNLPDEKKLGRLFSGVVLGPLPKAKAGRPRKRKK